MYEVKQGRAQSLFSAVFGLAFAGIGAAVMVGSWHQGASAVMFAAMFVVIGLATMVYSLYNATAKNRPDEYDITTDKEEPDPLNQRFGSK